MALGLLCCKVLIPATGEGYSLWPSSRSLHNRAQRDMITLVGTLVYTNRRFYHCRVREDLGITPVARDRGCMRLVCPSVDMWNKRDARGTKEEPERNMLLHAGDIHKVRDVQKCPATQKLGALWRKDSIQWPSIPIPHTLPHIH